MQIKPHTTNIDKSTSSASAALSAGLTSITGQYEFYIQSEFYTCSLVWVPQKMSTKYKKINFGNMFGKKCYETLHEFIIG